MKENTTISKVNEESVKQPSVTHFKTLTERVAKRSVGPLSVDFALPSCSRI